MPEQSRAILRTEGIDHPEGAGRNGTGPCEAPRLAGRFDPILDPYLADPYPFFAQARKQEPTFLWRRWPRTPASQIRTSSTVVSIASSVSRGGGSGHSQASPDRQQSPSRNPRATPYPSPGAGGIGAAGPIARTVGVAEGSSGSVEYQDEEVEAMKVPVAPISSAASGAAMILSRPLGTAGPGTTKGQTRPGLAEGRSPRRRSLIQRGQGALTKDLLRRPRDHGHTGRRFTAFPRYSVVTFSFQESSCSA
jgi:hypothetical protein